MNGIFLAASCLGALVTIAMAEPRMKELQAPKPDATAVSAQVVSFKPSQVADVSHDKGSMTTKTVVDVNASGQQTVTEERVIAFQD